MLRPDKGLRPRPIGFSLVEIMVGMVIGMLGVIVMMQVFALAEERKRTTTGGGDAMSEGVMALYSLQRDLRQAGYGIGDTKLLGCNVLLRAGLTLNNLGTVAINHPSIPAGDANTDTLLAIHGNGNGSPQGDGITSQPAANQYAVQTPTSFAVADWVIATPQISTCAATALALTQVGGVASPNVTVVSGVAGMTNGTLFNLGQAPKMVAYAIRGGNLTMCDFMAADCTAAQATLSAAAWAARWVPIANNIVSLRAQYGKDTNTPMDGIVNAYDQTAPTTACGWAKVSAVRLALVARSAQFEKTAVTAVAPTWEGSNADNPTGSAANAIDLSGGANWQNYRYKVFQTVVPVRNVAWMGVVSGC